MKTLKTCIYAALLLTLATAGSALQASELASATLTSTQVDPTTWLYDIQLDDIGTTQLGTFWFSWIPGQDYMNTMPTSITGPAGWNDVVTHGGATDGYAIQWVATAGSAVNAGNTLDGFQFESTTSPAQLLGNSPFFPTPELTSFAYGGAPFSDGGVRFVVQEASSPAGTPEPSTVALAITGAALLGLFKKVGDRKRASR